MDILIYAVYEDIVAVATPAAEDKFRQLKQFYRPNVKCKLMLYSVTSTKSEAVRLARYLNLHPTVLASVLRNKSIPVGIKEVAMRHTS